MNFEAAQTPLDVLALDVIGRYCKDRYSLSLNLKQGLLYLLPERLKTSSVALEISADSLIQEELRSRLYQEDPTLTFADLSFAAATTLSDYLNHPRTTIELATAYWALGTSARLSFLRIKEWESDPRQVASKFRAEEAWTAIKTGRIITDPEHSDGDYVVYQLPSGVYELLQPGLEILKTNHGTYPSQLAKQDAIIEIGQENYLFGTPPIPNFITNVRRS